MKEPRGEQVGLNFYFGDLPRVEAFARIAKHCCRHGGTFAKAIVQHESTEAGQYRFRHVYDRPLMELSVSLDELERKLEDKNVDIVKAAIWSGIGIGSDVPDIVTYNGVSQEASGVDNPAIALIGEGWVFSTPGYEREAKTAGTICYRRFIEICSAVNPVYASILNEDSLPCRYDLAHGEGKRCFTDFFVSDRAHGPDVIEAIEKLHLGSYIEKLANGLYVSSWCMYNPSNITIKSDVVIQRSASVARILGNV